jgi:hypothetical protein
MKDRAYLAWIRQQPCCIPGHECVGPIDAHHRTGAGLALKAPDRETMPLCRQGHINERHALAGYFKGWDKAKVKQWERDMVAHYQALHGQSHSCRCVTF